MKLPAAGETTATAFVDVDNPTMYAIYLLSASADVAGKVEMREMDKDGTEKPEADHGSDGARLRRRRDGAEGAAPGAVGFEASLKEGDTVWLSVVTEAGTKLDVAAPVKKE